MIAALECRMLRAMSAHDDDHDDDRRYEVVVNHEEQYSIWLAIRKLPAGWRTVGKSGTKGECLSYIDSHWTDMRPLSIRDDA